MAELTSHIRPLRDNLLLEQEPDEEITTAGGIIVNASDDKKQYHGVYARVLALGPDVGSRMIKVGSRVVVNRYDLLTIREGARALDLLKGEELVYAVCSEKLSTS